MAEDSALIWEAKPSRRKQSAPTPAASTTSDGSAVPADEAPIPGGRVSLREAQHQFGVSSSTIASWARSGKVDAVKEDGRWMVTPASVAAHLSGRHGDTPRSRRTGPNPETDSSTMLVPRDAWDKLLDQLGNLHEAGQMLADARERAAKAETEVTFLRERLSEIREERDEFKTRFDGPVPQRKGQPGFWSRLRSAFLPEAPPG